MKSVFIVFAIVAVWGFQGCNASGLRGLSHAGIRADSAWVSSSVGDSIRDTVEKLKLKAMKEELMNELEAEKEAIDNASGDSQLDMMDYRAMMDRLEQATTQAELIILKNEMDGIVSNIRL